MRKFLIAAATSLLIFGGQVDAEAAPVENLNAQIQMQEMKTHGKWAHFRDKYILGRETENERRDREEWESRHRRDYRDRHRDRHRYYRDDDYYYDPPPHYRYPPPPSPRHRYGYETPPPPPLR